LEYPKAAQTGMNISSEVFRFSRQMLISSFFLEIQQNRTELKLELPHRAVEKAFPYRVRENLLH